MEKKCPVSVIVMTKNEEKNIVKCLMSVSAFDQVFVVDSSSTDRTIELAQSMGAMVVDFKWNGKYPKKKQWCLENLPFRNNWVFYVDADEEVYPETAREIHVVISKNPAHSGYFAGYDYVFTGKVLKHGHQVFKLVLFNRHKGRFIDYDDLAASNMWEVEGHYQPRIEGSTGILKNKLLHNDHDSLFHYFGRHNRYSDWEAVVRSNKAIVKTEEAQQGLRKIMKVVFNALPFQGFSAFMHSYFFKLGFLDGRAGLDFALSRAFYYWQVSIKKRELAVK